MTPPTKPDATQPLSGEEVLFLVQDGRIRKMTASEIHNELKNSRRIEVVETVGNTPFTFSSEFPSPPIVIPLSSWSGNQRVEPYVTSLSSTSVTLAAKRTRSTTLLSSGPYEDAPNTLVLSAIVIEK